MPAPPRRTVAPPPSLPVGEGLSFVLVSGETVSFEAFLVRVVAWAHAASHLEVAAGLPASLRIAETVLDAGTY